MKPVLFVAGHVGAHRVGALTELHARERIELALFGGRLHHGGPVAAEPPGVPSRRVRPHELRGLAASGAYRAVICPTSGRLAPLATWAGARRARVPLIVWASLWAHPRTAAHAFTYLPLRRLYSSADAVVTYGEHVSSYVRARGARNVYVAPQSVDNEFWGAPAAPAVIAGLERRGPGGLQPGALGERDEPVRFLFVGRAAREKGLGVLLRAWQRSGLRPQQAALLLVGAELPSALGPDGGVHALGTAGAIELRSIYAAADVLVVPSIQTRTFREPWGLVVNEAMNRALAVITSDAVGAAAGGLVRDGENGIVVPAGDADALAAALVRLAGAPELRRAMGRAGALAVRAYSHAAWAEGFSLALASLGVSASASAAAASLGEAS